MKYGLSEQQLEQVINFIAGYSEIEQAVLFGSRAMDTFKEASDVDIAIKGEKVTTALAAKLKFDIEEDTYLPFFFDVVAYPDLKNAALCDHIDTKGIVIFRRGVSEWREYKLAELGTLQRGRSRHRPRYAFHLYGGKYPFIQTGEIREARKYIRNYEQTYNEAGLEQSKLWSENTLCITIAANIAELAILSFDACFPDSVLGFIPNKDKADLNFIYYTLVHFQKELKHIGEGSVQDNINLGTFQNISFPIPNLPEQKAIAAVLSSLDDKIDLLHRQNKTLEAMAETLFKQWFIVEAREGLEIGKVSDIVDFNPTRQLSKGTIAPYLEMASLSTEVFHPANWYDREFSSGTKFINGDTLLARITPCLENGKSSYVSFLNENQVGWGSTEYIVMRSKLGLHPFFTYALAKNSDFRDYAEGCLSGSSGRQRIDITHLKNYALIIPSRTVIDKFNAIISSIAPKLHNNFIQIRTLESLRDNLLPKLMSGEVRVTCL